MLDWGKHIRVADRFQYKAKAQDGEELRHTIILRLAQAARNIQLGWLLTEANCSLPSELGRNWRDRLP